MSTHFPSQFPVRFLGRTLQAARQRARAARARGEVDLGASALEWAIIAAIVVVAASVIGGALYGVVKAKSTKLETCANQPVNTTCAV
ncbi:hypothetical protein CLV92_101481 [Kineococcus xinjiangensis]|uniref:Flp pilus assembly pilin Flp n=1 Tax=Kineococcus xinjiangensis TaxID=512762 RepID=A0A2S6IX21_9ACTN|nr:hypothetical protein [Kineococcus xinjiangensis]PPK98780.1 hypothetical protein CLV92_101481 [Kineococcus xinjiangensis]